MMTIWKEAIKHLQTRPCPRRALAFDPAFNEKVGIPKDFNRIPTDHIRSKGGHTYYDYKGRPTHYNICGACGLIKETAKSCCVAVAGKA